MNTYNLYRQLNNYPHRKVVLVDEIKEPNIPTSIITRQCFAAEPFSPDPMKTHDNQYNQFVWTPSKPQPIPINPRDKYIIPLHQIHETKIEQVAAIEAYRLLDTIFSAVNTFDGYKQANIENDKEQLLGTSKIPYMLNQAFRYVERQDHCACYILANTKTIERLKKLDAFEQYKNQMKVWTANLYDLTYANHPKLNDHIIILPERDAAAQITCRSHDPRISGTIVCNPQLVAISTIPDDQSSKCNNPHHTT